ncbi:hypothetical protein MRX96_002069 [Rhipicephalus microplus]
MLFATRTRQAEVRNASSSLGVSEAQGLSWLGGKHAKARGCWSPSRNALCIGDDESACARPEPSPIETRPLERTEIGRDIARHLVALPLPRNIHPQRNEERWVARALAETHASDSTAVYVDAAKHQYRPHTYVAVVVRATDGKLLNACSVRATFAEQAEEAAIALALNGTPEVTTILSDSRTAIANLGRGSIGTPAASLLPKSNLCGYHRSRGFENVLDVLSYPLFDIGELSSSHLVSEGWS